MGVFAFLKRLTSHQGDLTGLEFVENESRQRRVAAKDWQQVVKARRAQDKAERTDRGQQFPQYTWAAGGEPRPRSLRGTRRLKMTGIPTTAHTAATAYPFVAGPSLGPDGIYLGRDRNGGGAFCFDPWQLYGRKIISGMSMMLFGQLGTGKSSLAKSLAMRSVQAGRKLSVASDKKGEWTKVVKALGGVVIQVGPGGWHRVNPLDAGSRPSRNPQGEAMADEEWAMMVRTRRMAILVTLARILTSRELNPAEHHVVSMSLDEGVAAAEAEARTVIIPDVIAALERMKAKHADPLVVEAASIMAMTLHRVTTGDLSGMFDGESTVEFDPQAPAVSIDSSALHGASPEAVRVVNACAGAWTEAMVTNSDHGQRLVIYEEGWDNISSEADLQRMVEGWKLARAYGLFNILIMHKIADLDMAGDRGSKMAAMAKSLLADADVKVIYRQDRSALRVTMEELELSDRERSLLKNLHEGVGLWRLGDSSFEVKNDLTKAEKPLTNTDERLETTSTEAEKEGALT